MFKSDLLKCGWYRARAPGVKFRFPQYLGMSQWSVITAAGFLAVGTGYCLRCDWNVYGMSFYLHFDDMEYSYSLQWAEGWRKRVNWRGCAVLIWSSLNTKELKTWLFQLRYANWIQTFEYQAEFFNFNSGMSGWTLLLCCYQINWRGTLASFGLQ